MYTGKVLVLTEEDRNEQPIKNNINQSNFITHKDVWKTADIVIYVNDKGSSRILLNRFGDIDNQDYRKQASELAKKDLKQYYKELNKNKGFLECYESIHENILSKKYTKEAQAKYNEFYIKHLEELCLY